MSEIGFLHELKRLLKYMLEIIDGRLIEKTMVTDKHHVSRPRKKRVKRKS